MCQVIAVYVHFEYEVATINAYEFIRELANLLK